MRGRPGKVTSSVKTRVAMHIGRGPQFPPQRPGGTTCDGNVIPSGQAEDDERIDRRSFYRLVPATVVRPRTSISGLASARRIAIASSCPGSQSMITG